MKKIVVFYILLFSFCACMANVPEEQEKPGWRLTFQDEFDEPVLNDYRWYSSYRPGLMLRMKQLGKKPAADKQVELSPNAHYVIEDGILKLRIDEKLPARPEKSDNCVSGIQTSDFRYGANNEIQFMDKFAQKYGWFEIRSRMPSGSGLNSAFWLTQSDPRDQEVVDGVRVTEGLMEIDIFEQLGRQTGQHLIQFHVHITGFGSIYNLGFDPSKEFHVYALEWEEGALRWYVDGKMVLEYIGETPLKKMFVLLDLYQNSGTPGWTGTTDPNMPYPRDFEIDYIRVYVKD